jgi:hypothetical protein
MTPVESSIRDDCTYQNLGKEGGERGERCEGRNPTEVNKEPRGHRGCHELQQVLDEELGKVKTSTVKDEEMRSIREYRFQSELY